MQGAERSTSECGGFVEWQEVFYLEWSRECFRAEVDNVYYYNLTAVCMCNKFLVS